MGEIIATFADGRMLVQEDQLVEYDYCGSGVPFRIRDVRAVEKIISLTTDLDKLGLVTPLSEAWVGYLISGGPWSGRPQLRQDHIMVVMRRGDIPTTNTSGYMMSGPGAQGLMSSITSGRNFLAELVSGLTTISGVVRIRANVIGH